MNGTRFTQRHARLRRQVDERLSALVRSSISSPLIEGCQHVLLMGGKRVRALLVLLSAEAVGGKVKDALAAAAATEILHNFTLVHDDIMDHAAARRGKPTVHTQWDVNYALLVGDVLVGLAYHSLLATHSPHLQRMSRLFTEGLLEVCDGQALDLGHEKLPPTTMREYFAMIEKKTARLFSMATELGALAGGGTPPKVRALRRFGHYLGRAFQIQDDLLDIIASQQELGKTIGADIRERKQTFLWLTALAQTTGKERKMMLRVMDPRSRISSSTVAHVTRIYQTSGAIDLARAQIRRDTRKATAALRSVGTNEATTMLRWFSERLLHRVS
jgi:geranylgeranyl diphosphate synthase type II